MKKNKNTYFACLFFILCQTLLPAQQEAADKAYQKLGYKEAIDLYREEKLTVENMERVAHGYRLNHDTQNAERWYAQIVGQSTDPQNILYYAQALHSNGNLEKAKQYYLKYDKAVGGNDQRGRVLADAIDRISNFKDNEEIQVELAASINSPKLDFSPAYFQNGIVFVSNRPQGREGSKEKDLWTGDDYNTHYFAAENKDGSLRTPEPFSLQLDGKFHGGPLTFSKSGDQVYFTRNVTKRNKRKEYGLQIFTAFQSGDEFGDVKKLNFGDDQSNDAHPALSPDGQVLYFASDREGGHGGMDLYQSSFSGGQWTDPINLGSSINTAGNEVFPFVYDDGTLYFASDGWGGLGGLDVFYTEKTAEEKWGTPENIGTPINSNKDDFSYVLNALGTEGYFTSARDGGAGKDDIYHFTLAEPQGNKKKKEQPVFARICVYDEKTNERLSGVKVNVLTENGEGGYQGFENDFVVKLVPTEAGDEFIISMKRRDPFGGFDNENETYTTNEAGHFDLKVKPNRNYAFIAKADNYHETQIEFSVDDLQNRNGEFCIPLTAAECVDLSGIVTNREYGNPIPFASITLIDLCLGETLMAESDEGGRYEFSCIPCNCDFIVKAEKENFVASSGMASTVGMECFTGSSVSQDLELHPAFNDDGSPYQASHREDGRYNNSPNSYKLNGSNGAGRPHNRSPRDNADDLLSEGLTMDIKDIYYDFDEYYIRNYDAAPDLNNLVSILLRHPNLRAELASHTDSRGDYDYNMTLSGLRANAAVDYIIKRGVEPHRISAKGYGESRLINECADGVECSEEKHQMNRRTEVTVYGSFGG